MTNLHRRQLTPSQRSMVAAKFRKYYDDQAKERQRAAGGDHSKKAVVEKLPQAKARDAAGKDFGVSGKSVGVSGKSIRDDERWKEGGFDSWNEYLKKRGG